MKINHLNALIFQTSDKNWYFNALERIVNSAKNEAPSREKNQHTFRHYDAINSNTIIMPELLCMVGMHAGFIQPTCECVRKNDNFATTRSEVAPSFAGKCMNRPRVSRSRSPGLSQHPRFKSLPQIFIPKCFHARISFAFFNQQPRNMISNLPQCHFLTLPIKKRL